MQWFVKSFNELSTKELFDIFKLRVDVFVVEQNCAYPEIDPYDLVATHIFCIENKSVLAYCRVILTDSQSKIGRVVVDSEHRNRKLGRQLVERALDYCASQPFKLPVFAQAQAYLEDFYRSFGFQAISNVYDEDGIPHIDMLLTTDGGE